MPAPSLNAVVIMSQRAWPAASLTTSGPACQIRARAKKKAAITAGLVVSTRARFRSTAALETTDDARFHDVTQAQPPRWNGPSLRNP